MNLSIKLLTYVVVLDEEKNFARAADRVHLSQSAFSRAIQSIEDEIGMLIFDRGTRHVCTTEVGTYIVARAQKLLKESRSLKHDIGLLRSSDIGNIAIGVSPNMAVSVLPDALVEMFRRHPRVSIQVDVRNKEQLQEALLKEQIELFISNFPSLEGHPEIEITRAGIHSGGFFCRAGHPLLKKKEVTAADIHAYRFTCTQIPKTVDKRLRAFLNCGLDEPLPLSVQCDNLKVMRDVVLQTDMLLLAMNSSVAYDLESGAMVELPVVIPRKFYAEIGIARLVDRTPAPATAQFIEIMRTISLRLSDNVTGQP